VSVIDPQTILKCLGKQLKLYPVCNYPQKKVFEIVIISSLVRKRILTHYEILGLKESCSSQDIRESFVTLSKKYHPDKNSLDSSLHEKFVKINDAYSILSKNTLRRSYDLDLRAARAIEINHRMSTNNYYNTQNEPDPSSFMYVYWIMRLIIRSLQLVRTI